MSKTYKDSPKRRAVRQGKGRERHISVRAVRRDPPDLRKCARALISQAMAEAAAEAEAAKGHTDRQASADDQPAPPSEPGGGARDRHV